MSKRLTAGERATTNPLYVKLFMLGCFSIPMLAFRIKGVAVSDLLFGLGAVVQAFTCRQPKRVPGAWKGAAVLAMAGATLAAFRANSVLSNYAVGLRLVYVFTVWPWAGYAVLSSQKRALQAIRLFVAGAALSGLVGLLEIHGLHVPGTGLQGNRAPGLTQQVNDQGAVLGAATPMALALWVRSESKRLSRFGLVSFVFCAIGLIVSGSLSGMIGAAAGVAVLWARGRSLKSVLKGGAILTAGYVVGVGLLGHHGLNPLQRLHLTTNPNAPYGQDTTASRIETWHLAWSHIVHNPVIGRGLDPSSGILANGFAPHDFILLAWYQGGLLALVGVLWAVAHSLSVGWRRHGNLLAEASFASFSAAIAYALTAPVLFDRFFWFPAMLLIIVPSLPALDQGSKWLRGRLSFNERAPAGHSGVL